MTDKWKKNTAIFLACQAVTIFGSSLVQYAITWHVTLTTKSGTDTALIIIFGFLPSVFLSPFAGVWADRYNKKNIIMFADAAIAVCTLSAAVSFLLGYDKIWVLMAASAARSLGSAVQNPCVGALLPELVPKEHLTRVNGINNSMQSFIMIVSPMISGAVLNFAGIGALFFVDVITAAVSITAMMLFLKIPHVRHEALNENAQSSYSDELKAGFAYIKQHSYLKNYFVFCGIFLFMAAPAAFLTPLQTARTFGEDVWRLTAVELFFSAGMMLGGLLTAVWHGMKNRVHTMALGCALLGLVTFGLGVSDWFWMYLALMGICGIAVPVYNTPAIVLLQEKVDPDYLGRVFGVSGMIGSSMMPLGMLLFGPLADIVRIEVLLAGTGLFMLIVTVFLLNNAPLLRAGERSEA